MNLSDFLKPDTAISLCAAIVAICALSISIWQAVLSHRYNRLSVQPHLRVDRPLGKIILLNTGLGPARILSVVFFVDDEVCTGDSFESLARAAKKLNLVGRGVVALVPAPGEVMCAGEVQALLSFNDFDRSSAVGMRTIKDLGRMGLCIKYESLYGDSAELLVPNASVEN